MLALNGLSTFIAVSLLIIATIILLVVIEDRIKTGKWPWEEEKKDTKNK